MALGLRTATNFNRNRLKIGAVFLQLLPRDNGDQGSGALRRELGEQCGGLALEFAGHQGRLVRCGSRPPGCCSN